MANFTECEKFVIEKLISVFSKTLSCYTEEHDQSEVQVLEKILETLLLQNSTMFSNGDGSGRRDAMRSILDEQEFIFNGENSTDLLTLNGKTPPILGGGGTRVETTVDKNSSTEPNRLHQLEIIKVFVLIFVISIILLTTCRMVFQLFIRFRPEKPPLA